MDLKKYKQLMSINFNADLKPGDVGCLEFSKNRNGQKYCRIVAAGDLHNKFNYLFKEVINHINRQKEEK